MSKHKHFIEDLLAKADIRINGSRSWDLKINDERTYALALAQGSLGFGEAYMDGWWDCDHIDQMLTKLFEADIDKKVRPIRTVLPVITASIVNQQRKSKAFEVGKAHYDVGNDLYKHMLDARMVYTCGYWKDADDLNDAQEAKLDLVCKKIGLEKGMRVLDIGCGWGSFAKYASRKYGVDVVGITVSQKQVDLARELCAGLPVEIRLQDYRDVTGTFDAVVSLGMFEHVGVKNYRTYMRKVHDLLPNHGLFLLHTIGRNITGSSTDPWIAKYIFPNSMLPSVAQIGSSIEGQFVMEDWHNFGTDYDKTLQVWYKNIEASWNDLEKKYNERFRRMWRFYILSSAATFRARRNQLWQIVLSKGGVTGGYHRL
jgi:cyclopropane-fatty-acyl-phospholipid synthase